MQMLDDFHAARCSAGSRSSSRTITWLPDMQMVAWAWDKQEGCKFSTLLFIYFSPHQSLREMPKASQQPAWLEVSAGGRRLCRIRNLLQEGHWMAAGKTALDTDTTVWQCDGWKHTGPARRWKKRNLRAVAHAVSGETVPSRTSGKKRHDGNSRNVLLTWTFRPDVTKAAECSRLFMETKKENKPNAHKYSKPAPSFLVGSLDLTLPESSKHHHATFLCSVACLFQHVSW